MINIRLGMHHSKLEKSVEFIEAVKRHPGCCDEVWFASEYGFPKLERHKAIAESIAELSKLYKDAILQTAQSPKKPTPRNFSTKPLTYADFYGIIYYYNINDGGVLYVQKTN